MKLHSTILCILLLGIRCAAQLPAEKVQLEQKIVRYKRMKNMGVTFAALGAVAFVAGAVTMSNNPPDILEGGFKFGTGFGLLIVGAAGLGSGITLLSIGAHNKRKYEKQLTGLSVRLNVRPGYKGLGLSYRF